MWSGAGGDRIDSREAGITPQSGMAAIVPARFGSGVRGLANGAANDDMSLREVGGGRSHSPIGSGPEGSSPNEPGTGRVPASYFTPAHRDA